MSGAGASVGHVDSKGIRARREGARMPCNKGKQRLRHRAPTTAQGRSGTLQWPAHRTQGLGHVTTQSGGGGGCCRLTRALTDGHSRDQTVNGRIFLATAEWRGDLGTPL